MANTLKIVSILNVEILLVSKLLNMYVEQKVDGGV